MRHLTEISHMVAQAIILEQLQMMTAESELFSPLNGPVFFTIII